MCDSKGVIHDGRNDLTDRKHQFALHTPHRTLADALEGADVFIGVSKPNLMDAAMVQSMAPDPAIFAMSNPVPEVMPELVHEVRSDVFMATGRSDYPNQINNVLGSRSYSEALWMSGHPTSP
jgi:malic enzyme